MNELGAAIRRKRVERGLSLRATARAAGITGAFLSMVETGKANPSAASLERITRALGTTSADLRQSADEPLLRNCDFADLVRDHALELAVVLSFTGSQDLLQLKKATATQVARTAKALLAAEAGDHEPSRQLLTAIEGLRRLMLTVVKERPGRDPLRGRTRKDAMNLLAALDCQGDLERLREQLPLWKAGLDVLIKEVEQWS